MRVSRGSSDDKAEVEIPLPEGARYMSSSMGYATHLSETIDVKWKEWGLWLPINDNDLD